jgi:hypothetical protein
VDGDKVALPFWVEGDADVGAAMITLGYPADRYRAVVHLPATGGWLRLQDTAAGEARVGLVRFQGIEGVYVEPSWQTLELTLKPGARHGGSIGVKRVEFSGIEGERLDANPDRPSVSLEPPPPLALAAPRPNPSSGATTISLTLSIEAETAVEVYDLSGRRVATVHRGTLAAGVHDLTWNGRGDGGVTLGAGIYFVRATAAGVTESRRIVVL